ncbi:hypothetical protein LTR66_006595 [Elasticomyces elasticus]|nr:hypothetical protein LTR66_006595 [Elasticomyces elasticus]
MVYSLSYRRPSFVSSSRDSMSGTEKQKSINDSINSCTSGASRGIPEALSFDRIVAGGTCPPCTVRDFLNYLKYIEHAAENLQFYLWFLDYSKRFDKLSAAEKALAPPWTKAQAQAESHPTSTGHKLPVSRNMTEVLAGTDFADGPKAIDNEKSDPFHTPPRTPSSDEKRDGVSEYGSTLGGESMTLTNNTSFSKKAEEVFDEAGMKWQPCEECRVILLSDSETNCKPVTSQPYREEITRVIAIYIADNGARQLNLSSRERKSVLHALQNTTHPSAFQSIMANVEFSLRRQAHPNFIRWTICNGNRPRVIFARGLGVFLISAALLADLLITLSHAGRAWRVLPLIVWVLGISTLIAAWKGMCVVLHGMHHRHLRPWELFASDDDDVMFANVSSVTLVGNLSNSYEDEPWVPKYEKRNVIRKILDREVWIQEPALRQIQDTIFVQSLVAAFILGAIAVGIFCAVPHGGFY